MKKILLILMLSLVMPTGAFGQGRITITDFSGGLNTRMSANQLPPNQASELMNFLVDEKVGSLVSREGYSLWSSTNATEIFEYKRPNGQTFLIKHYQGELSFTIDRGKTWTVITEGLNWELNPVRATVYNDYFVATNGIDDVVIFDGRNASSYDFIPKGKYVVSHYNRLFVANTWESPRSIYFNKISEDITDKSAWDYVANYEEINETITGLATYRGQLVIFSEDSVWALLGSSPLDWRIIEVSSDYGCIHHESIAVNGGLLKFSSKSGVKAYNGSDVVDIDFQVNDIVQGAGNLSGGYNYLIYNNTRDFEAVSSTGIDTTMNEIKLNSYSDTWEGDDLDGTLSGVSFSVGELSLSTTTTISLTTYEKSTVQGEWGIAGFVDLLNADDGDKNTYAEAAKDYQGNIPFKSTDLSYSVVYGDLYNIKEIRLLAEYELRASVDVEVHGRSAGGRSTAKANAGGYLKEGAVRTFVDADLYLTFEDGTGGDSVYSTRRVASLDSPRVYGVEVGSKKWYEGLNKRYKYIFKYAGVATDSFKKEIVFPVSGIQQKVAGVKIVFRLSGDSRKAPNKTWFPISELSHFSKIEPGGERHRHKLTKIFDTVMEYSDEQEQYEAAGSFELEPKGFGTTVKFGSATVGGVWSEEAGTEITFETSSDGGGSWQELVIDTTTLSGAVQSGDGVELSIRGQFNTSVSTATPRLYWIDVVAVEPSGSITLEKSQVADVAGGWSYFVAKDDLEGQSAVYSVRLAESAEDIEGVGFTPINSGSLIGGTTNQDWIQFKVDLQTDDGTINPRVEGLTAMYIPVSPPIFSQAISIDGRYHLALSTGGADSNNVILMQDKNNAWTMFDIPVKSFTSFGVDYLFSGEGGIYKMYDGTTDNGRPILSKWEKVIAPDPAYNVRLAEILTTGQGQTDGALNLSYKIANSTEEFTVSNIDVGEGGRFRHRQPSGALRSSGLDWTVIYKSTAPAEINMIDMWIDVDPILRGTEP